MRPFRATQVGGSEGRHYRGRTKAGLSGAASFRIVPRLQKPAFGVGAQSRLVPSGNAG